MNDIFYFLNFFCILIKCSHKADRLTILHHTQCQSLKDSWSPAPWCGRLSLCLQSQHPLWVLVQCLVAPFPILKLHAYDLGEQKRIGQVLEPLNPKTRETCKKFLASSFQPAHLWPIQPLGPADGTSLSHSLSLSCSLSLLSVIPLFK